LCPVVGKLYQEKQRKLFGREREKGRKGCVSEKRSTEDGDGLPQARTERKNLQFKIMANVGEKGKIKKKKKFRRGRGKERTRREGRRGEAAEDERKRDIT